jgi:DNA-binding response OmpR family regulator
MPHVLVIEERRRARARLSRVLLDAGYAVSEARDGRMALELARKGRPDLIIHGHVTPGASEFLAVRRVDPALSTIALITTVTRPDLAEGADVCLSERFTADDLFAAVRRCEERDHVGVGVRRTVAPQDSGAGVESLR